MSRGRLDSWTLPPPSFPPFLHKKKKKKKKNIIIVWRWWRWRRWRWYFTLERDHKRPVATAAANKETETRRKKRKEEKIPLSTQRNETKRKELGPRTGGRKSIDTNNAIVVSIRIDRSNSRRRRFGGGDQWSVDWNQSDFQPSRANQSLTRQLFIHSINQSMIILHREQKKE